VPVIKVATRNDLARRWHDLMDVNAGRIATGEASIEQVGWEMLNSCWRGQWPQNLGRALGPEKRLGAVQPGAHHLRPKAITPTDRSNWSCRFRLGAPAM
jgi:hypothetical protein